MIQLMDSFLEEDSYQVEDNRHEEGRQVALQEVEADSGRHNSLKQLVHRSGGSHREELVDTLHSAGEDSTG